MQSIAITSDCWSSEGNTHSLLSVTGHYVDNDFKPRYLVLGVIPIKGISKICSLLSIFALGRHTADNLSALIGKCLKEFEIPLSHVKSIVRDGASSMVKMSTLLGCESLHCFGHSLLLVC